MILIVFLAKVAVATLTSLTLVGASAAQTIRYEQGGRPQTYEFKSEALPREKTQGRRKAQARTDLPRGPKNIPWDEPGKISGVPGVSENSATSLPEKRARPAGRKEGAGRSAASRKTNGLEAEHKPSPAPPERSPQILDRSAKVPSHGPEHNKVAGEGPGPAARPGNSQEQTAKATDDNAEARAKVIERLRASAWAEEQRRLEAEKSRDRHVRTSAPRPSTEGNNQPRRATQSQPDPDHTGTLTTPTEGGPAAPENLGWKRKMCRMIFFGVMPGC